MWTVPSGARTVRLRGGGPGSGEARARAFCAAIEASAERIFAGCRGLHRAAHWSGPDRWALVVERGEMVARVRVQLDRDASGEVVGLRYGFDAEVRSLAAWTARRAAWLARGRGLGRLAGALVFATVCVQVIGVHAPIFVLGGLWMVVVLLVTLLGGGSAGEWIADRMAGLRLRRVRQRVRTDGILRADLRRLRRLVRGVGRHRRQLESAGDPHPFRAADPGPSQPRVACG